MTLIDGKSIAKTIEHSVNARVQTLANAGHSVTLAVILVGSDVPSHSYVRQKERAAKRVGIVFRKYLFPETISQAELLSEIHRIQQTDQPSGMIVQLPLPAHINTTTIVNAIDVTRDVDCLSTACTTLLERGEAPILPPTPGAMLAILDSLHTDVQQQTVTIFGAGMLVGKPLAILMKQRQGIVHVVTEATENKKELAQQADIIFSGVGKKGLITGDMVKPGAIVIDAGVDYDEHGTMYGDVDMETVLPVAAYVTPTPGGVGPITVAQLLLNTVICEEKKQSNVD